MNIYIKHLKYIKLDILKKICKKKIKISSLNKDKIIIKLIEYNSVVKLQRYFRKNILSNSLICPISMSNVMYPCFPFRPKGQTHFIYYDLNSISEYLLTSGDFRDPKTREEYTIDHLKLIDKLRKDNKILGKSLETLSKNNKFYKEKKDNEESILIIERCLDDIISSMRNLLENTERRRHGNHTLNTVLFMTFRAYFKRLVFYSRNDAHTLINRTIDLINETVNRPLKDKDVDPDVGLLRDNIIQFLFQLRFDELEDQ
jgi:hypothetical protein